MRKRFSLAVTLVMVLLIAGAVPMCANAGGDGSAKSQETLMAGREHTCAIKSDGTVICWGYNGQGQAAPPNGTFLQLGESIENNTCGVKTDGTVACWGAIGTPPTGTFKQVSDGIQHSCGLKTDGTLACWGDNTYGQLNSPVGTFIQVTSGDLFSCGLRENGTVTCWGPPGCRVNASASVFTQIATGQGTTCGIKTDGTLECWGCGMDGTIPSGTFAQVEVGYVSACGLRTDGTIACWGGNDWGQATPPAGTFIRVAAGSFHTCGLKDDGSVVCWGSNDKGQSSVTASISFGQRKLSAGTYHTCSVKPDGTPLCWGNNDSGQLTLPVGTVSQASAGHTVSCFLKTDGSAECNGTFPHGEDVTPPAGLYTQVSAGYYNACGLKDDGTATCWGGNPWGEGNVPAGTFKMLSSGLGAACGVKSDGALACWGVESNGRISSTPAGTFTQVGVPFEGRHICALKTDGTIACWGQNDVGQATPPSGAFMRVATGVNFTCGLKNDGTIACWGLNDVGQASPPTGVFRDLSAGDRHACAVKEDESISCWGANTYGQSGPNISLTASPLPTATKGLAYSQSVVATGGSSPYVYSVISGVMSDGLSMNAAGNISGTPTTVGSFNFAVKVVDNSGFNAQQTYALDVLGDTTPDAFNFISQTGMPINTMIVSNTITVTGINCPTAISISVGSYQINGGSWTTSAGTVNNGDTVAVRQTSSAINSTTTTATLTIGGVSGTFDVTTAASGDPDAGGLVSWWRAENNAYDSVGGNHGTPMNGATYDTGRVGQAFSFAGSNQYINIARSASLEPNNITVEFRMKQNGEPALYTPYVAKTRASGPYGGFLFNKQGGNRISFQANINGGWNVLTGTTSLTPGEWYLIVGTYDGSALRLYVNGSLDAEVLAIGSLYYADASTDLKIANSGDTPSLFFNGLIDEVKIFNRALSASEVKNLAGKPDDFSFTAQTGIPLATSIVSNPITVTGISSAAAISSTGGDYKINSGSWTSAAGTVNNGDTVQVRLTSSSSPSALATATLTIGGVSGTFDVTTAASGDPNATGLVSWWKAENNGYDAVGGNHGNAFGTVSYATGKSGQAFSFDGVDDYVEVPNSTSLNPAAAITVAAWYRPVSFEGNGSNAIVSKGFTSHAEPYYQYHIGVNGDQYHSPTARPASFSFTVSPGGNRTVIETAENTWIPGNWYYLVGIYDGSEVKLYVNGVLKASTVATGALTDYGKSLRIGAFNNISSSIDYTPGLIDEVKIFNRALSASEVAALSDIVPDAFAFTAQTGMPLSTTIVSNPITVTGIYSTTDISITGGEYSVSTNGGGAWSAYSSTTPATVSLNNKVKVRQTSSATNSTMTTASLTIGGVSGAFNVTTAASGDPDAGGLIAWWKAENDAYDSVGGNHGTATNGAAYAAGRVGQAFSLDGVNDYVDAGTNDAFNFNGGAGDFTIQAWIKMDSLPAFDAGIVGKATHGPGGQFTGPYSGWGFYVKANGRLAFGGPGVWEFTTGSGAITTGNWYHVAVTKNATTYRLYSNGQEVAPVSHGSLETSATSLRIGALYSDDEFFNGKIDEVKIFSRALTGVEIQNLCESAPFSFSFTAQTGMPLSTLIISNPITVSGICGAKAISISGGEYQINSGTWTSESGMVNNGDTVRVRQASSASNSVTTTATLTIGGVSGAFDVTTAASGDPNASGLVSWWKAENNGYDSVGGNHGTAMNGATYAAGKIDQAFSFDGVDDYVQTNYNFPFTSDFTIGVWVKPQQMGDLEFVVGTEDGFGASCGGWSITWNVPAASGKFGFAGGCGGNEIWTASSTANSYAVDQWHHVVVMFEGAVGKIYVDGVLDVQFSRSCTVIAGTNLRMGMYPNRMARAFKGLIDEVKIFNRALSVLEISTLAGTKPDAFSFSAQSGVSRSAIVESNAIAVTGITSPAAISITGGDGQYAVSTDNGSTWNDWRSAAGTVSLNNQVKVRQTASSSYSTIKTATLTIGGVEGAFTVTTLADTDKPVVTAFTLHASESSAMSVSVDAFIATDNSGIVSGYMVTDSATPPATDDPGWSATNLPMTVTLSIAGNNTLYAWAKDPAGNVSEPLPATVQLKPVRRAPEHDYASLQAAYGEAGGGETIQSPSSDPGGEHRPQPAQEYRHLGWI